ncbi:hypothetical protein BDY24DRAFT_395811 [Mrakia frigida]|uniref:uncharacterized protein n=1 Tax=Mrakia frigida TaxID=29902 RepID=UPI003FCBFBDD
MVEGSRKVGSKGRSTTLLLSASRLPSSPSPSNLQKWLPLSPRPLTVHLPLPPSNDLLSSSSRTPIFELKRVDKSSRSPTFSRIQLVFFSWVKNSSSSTSAAAAAAKWHLGYGWRFRAFAGSEEEEDGRAEEGETWERLEIRSMRSLLSSRRRSSCLERC